MGGMHDPRITLAHLDKFSHIGMFSGGSIGTAEIKDMADFKKKVKLVFVELRQSGERRYRQDERGRSEQGRYQGRLLRIPADRSRVVELASQPA